MSHNTLNSSSESLDTLLTQAPQQHSHTSSFKFSKKPKISIKPIWVKKKKPSIEESPSSPKLFQHHDFSVIDYWNNSYSIDPLTGKKEPLPRPSKSLNLTILNDLNSYPNLAKFHDGTLVPPSLKSPSQPFNDLPP
ncbi:hypothetical protein Tco_1381461 [Tanacetum coccineum]